MELVDYLQIARNYWRSIIAIVLISAIGVGLFSVLSRRTYTATTSIVLSVVSVANSAAEVYQGQVYAQTQVKSFALVATEPIVLQPVIDSLGLDTTPELLAKYVTATVPTNTAVIDLAVVNGDPDQVARIANALGEQLIAAVKQLSPPSANGGQAVVATIIRPAVAPTSPTSPRTDQNFALGVLIGIMLAAAQAVLRTVLPQGAARRSPSSASPRSTVIGSTKQDPPQEESPLGVVGDPGSLRSEP